MNTFSQTTINIDERMRALPREIQAAMGGYSAEQNQKIAENFSLTNEQVPQMVTVIAKTILGIVSLNNFFSELKNALPEFNEDKLKNLAVQILIIRFLPIRNYIKGVESLIIGLGGKIPDIIPELPEFPEEEEAKEEVRKTEARKPVVQRIVNLSLSQALETYPHLGEQLVTGNPIKIKVFPEPIRPSIKNWIIDYHYTLGAGTHGMMERANYLYHSENAKHLTAGERQKLALILKSLDERELITIDAEKREIVFQQTISPHPLTPSPGGSPTRFASLAESRRAESRRVGETGREWSRPAGPGEGLRFSYPQKMSSEREAPAPPRQTPPPPRERPATPLPPPPQPEPAEPPKPFRPYRIIPSGLAQPPGEIGEENENDKPEPKIKGNVVDLRN